MNMVSRLVLGTLVLSLASGCVRRSELDRQMALAAERERALQKKSEADAAAAQSRVSGLQAELEARGHKLADAEVELAALHRKFNEATALSDQLRQELKKAGRNVDALMAEKGSMNQALEDAKQRLEELRRAQEAAQKRADLFKNLIQKFKRMIDAGDLKIVLRDGRMVLQLRNDVLFDSGSVDVKPAGKDALKDVAVVLVTLTDRRLQVVGHTDNRPIQTGRFPSNWELSSSRAIAVVKFLVSQGVRAELLSAAGNSEYDPVAPNDSDDGRAKNRRIEIVLQPNLSELVTLPNE